LFNDFTELKRTPLVVGELLWKPFDIRFQDILERLKFHQSVLRDELKWAKLGNIQSTFEAEAQKADEGRQAAMQMKESMSRLEVGFDAEQRSVPYSTF
jgi:hypothetical protein